MSNVGFITAVMDRLSSLGPFRARAMFGGHGIYYRDLMIALVAFDRLYFKVTELNKNDFASFQAEPFIYDGHSKPVRMSYYELPDVIWNDDQRLLSWAEKAYEGAQQSKKPPKVKKSKP